MGYSAPFNDGAFAADKKRILGDRRHTSQHRITLSSLPMPALAAEVPGRQVAYGFVR
jgi:hypothetical protein